METVTDILLRIMGIVERFRTGSILSTLQVAAFAALLVFGVLNCILGYRLLRFWMMLFAFGIGMGLGFGGSFLMDAGSMAVRLGIGAGVGVVLAVIVFFSYKAGIFVLGAGLGIGLGVYILHPTTSLMFFICLLIGVLMGSLAMKWAREVIIVGTSLLGGAMAGMSLAKLSGLANLPYGVGLSVGFALLGMLIQFATNKPKYVEEDEEEEPPAKIRQKKTAEKNYRAEKTEDEERPPVRRRNTSERTRREAASERKQPVKRKSVHKKSAAAEEQIQRRRTRPSDRMELDSEKTVVYRPRKKKELDLPLDSYVFQDSYTGTPGRKTVKSVNPYAASGSAARKNADVREQLYRSGTSGGRKLENLYYDDDADDEDPYDSDRYDEMNYDDDGYESGRRGEAYPEDEEDFYEDEEDSSEDGKDFYEDEDDSYEDEPIDEDKLDEKILREMMEDDDRESIFPWKKSSDRKRRKR